MLKFADQSTQATERNKSLYYAEPLFVQRSCGRVFIYPHGEKQSKTHKMQRVGEMSKRLRQTENNSQGMEPGIFLFIHPRYLDAIILAVVHLLETQII